MTPQAHDLSPSEEDDDLDDDDVDEDEDDEVEQDEEDEEEEETWQVGWAPGNESSAVLLTSAAQVPTLAQPYGRRASRIARSSMALIRSAHVAVRCSEMFSALSHIGGHGYANRDNRTTPHRQRLRLYSR
jgi:hypothetical protein